jgi:hypothetical protein
MAIKQILKQSGRTNGAVCFWCLLANGELEALTVAEIVARSRAEALQA